MIRRKYNLNLVDDKPKNLAVVRAIVIFSGILVVVLTLTGVVVFSCVHGTAI